MKHDEDPSPPPLPLHYLSDCLQPLGVKVWRMSECSLRAILLRWCPLSGANRPSIFNVAISFSASVDLRRFLTPSPLPFFKTQWKCGPFQRPSDPFKPFKIFADSTRAQSVGQPLKGQNTCRRASIIHWITACCYITLFFYCQSSSLLRGKPPPH